VLKGHAPLFKQAKRGHSMVSGGADPSIHLWDLESRGSELDHLHRSIASLNKLRDLDFN
jgi:hypothetical protein